MVKITMEFPTLDAAIVALGKLSSAADTTIVDGKPRRGRSDKGLPRKSRSAPTESNAKGEGAGAQSEGAAEATVASAATPAAAPAPAASQVAAAAGTKDGGTSTNAEPAAKAPDVAGAKPATAEDAQKAIEKLYYAPPPVGGLEQARIVMSRFGVKRVRDLQEDQRAEFIALAEKVLAGGAA